MEKGFFVETKEMVEEYVEDHMLLLRLQLSEKAAKASSALFIGVVICFFLLILFMIISFIAGYYLSMAVGSYGGGFGILAGVYILLIFILIYMHRSYFSKYITNKVVQQLFKDKRHGNRI